MLGVINSVLNYLVIPLFLIRAMFFLMLDDNARWYSTQVQCLTALQIILVPERSIHNLHQQLLYILYECSFSPVEDSKFKVPDVKHEDNVH